MNESEMIKKAMPVCLEPLNDKYRPIIKKALEDVQKYRTIGTVEECRENKEFLNFLYNRINPNDMEQYLSMYNCSDEKIN